MKRRHLILLLLLAGTLAATAQPDGCTSRLTGSDKSTFDKAVEHFDNKRYSQCVSLMRQVSQKHREAADPYFYLAAATARGEGKPGVVRGYLNRLFKVCPDYPNALAYFYLGLVEYSSQNYDEAVVQLNRYFDMTHATPTPAWEAVYEEASSYLYWSEFLSEAYRNQTPFNPEVLQGPSSKQDEFLPYLSLDGSELYFLRKVSVESRATYYAKELDSKVLRLFVSHPKDSGYSYGEQLPSPFNEYGEEGGVTMTADNNLLYYSVMMPEVGYNNCDIFFSRRQNGVWQPLENAGRNVNGKQSWESQPSITPDGQFLYFASNRNGGYGGTDIWYCRRLPNGDWSRAENLGPSVNTAGNEKCPFVHADGHTLYFASNGWQGFGGYDMYFSDLNDNQSQFPTNMGLPINSEEDDICVGVTTDGKRGYFANKSPDYEGVGGTDIFTFELYPAAQPEAMTIVKGRLRTADNKPQKGTIVVLRDTPEASRYLVDTPDGTFAVALATQSSNTMVVSVDGYLPITLCGKAAQLQRDINSASFTLLAEKLWGRYPLPLPRGANPGELSDDAKTILEAYADYLLARPRVHLRIEAPTLEGAKAIYDYLVALQLRAERFEYKPVPSLGTPQLVITQI
ncbi:MAG: hypothetical protein K5864_03825 [Bacteroidales bacterium]|nr:hypothetical protein [Bacteroidales bacterium]